MLFVYTLIYMYVNGFGCVSDYVPSSAKQYITIIHCLSVYLVFSILVLYEECKY